MEEKIGHHPESYVVHPNGKHKTTLILLHGTSTSGPEFADSFLDFPFSFPSPFSSKLSPSQIANQVKKNSLWVPELEFFKTPKTSLRKELAKGGVLEGVKVVFPTGSLKKTTVFGGRETCAWFDVHDFSDRTRGEDDQIIGMRESLGYLKGLVKGEVRLLDGKGGKVILGGFSQGCAMGVVGVLSGEFEGMGLGGFAGFSGWLPFRQQVDEVMSRADVEGEVAEKLEGVKRKGLRGYLRWMWTFFLRFLGRISWLLPWVLRKHLMKTTMIEENDEGARRRKAAVHYIRTLLSLPSRNLDISPKMPILLGHGTSDQKVKYEWALQMQHSLMDMGLNVKARKYEEVAHWYCEEEMKDMVNFLKDMWNLK